jgi:hypothetical protein
LLDIYKSGWAAIKLGNSKQVLYFNSIPVVLPEDTVYSRLGRNRFLNKMTEVQKSLMGKYIAEGIALCHPAGCWLRLNIVERNAASVTLENGDMLNSASLAELLASSQALLLTASTVGCGIVEASAAAAVAGEGVKALVYDAVGSEMADEAIGWIHSYVDQQLKRSSEKLTRRRFSPGYGDLGLENQKIIYDLLNLDKLGIRLNESLTMVPEKSVTAISGIEKS